MQGYLVNMAAQALGGLPNLPEDPWAYLKALPRFAKLEEEDYREALARAQKAHARRVTGLPSTKQIASAFAAKPSPSDQAAEYAKIVELWGPPDSDPPNTAPEWEKHRAWQRFSRKWQMTEPHPVTLPPRYPEAGGPADQATLEAETLKARRLTTETREKAGEITSATAQDAALRAADAIRRVSEDVTDRAAKAHARELGTACIRAAEVLPEGSPDRVKAEEVGGAAVGVGMMNDNGAPADVDEIKKLLRTLFDQGTGFQKKLKVSKHSADDPVKPAITSLVNAIKALMVDPTDERKQKTASDKARELAAITTPQRHDYLNKWAAQVIDLATVLVPPEVTVYVPTETDFGALAGLVPSSSPVKKALGEVVKAAEKVRTHPEDTKEQRILAAKVNVLQDISGALPDADPDRLVAEAVLHDLTMPSFLGAPADPAQAKVWADEQKQARTYLTGALAIAGSMSPTSAIRRVAVLTVLGIREVAKDPFNTGAKGELGIYDESGTLSGGLALTLRQLGDAKGNLLADQAEKAAKLQDDGQQPIRTSAYWRAYREAARPAAERPGPHPGAGPIGPPRPERTIPTRSPYTTERYISPEPIRRVAPPLLPPDILHEMRPDYPVQRAPQEFEV